MNSMKRANRALVLGFSVIFWGLAVGCSSGAHATAGRPPEPSSPPYLAQSVFVDCKNSIECCIKKFPTTAAQSCGATEEEIAKVLLGAEILNEASRPGDESAAEADVAEVEEAEDWSSIKDLPEWKQRCIKYYNTCKSQGWSGSCHDCMRRCEAQHEWPLRMCGPRR